MDSGRLRTDASADAFETAIAGAVLDTAPSGGRLRAHRGTAGVVASRRGRSSPRPSRISRFRFRASAGWGFAGKGKGKDDQRASR